MTFGGAIKTCFRKYATFSGRARRREYWFFFLFIALVQAFLSLIQEKTGMKPILTAIFSLIVLLPSLAVFWRRMHDTGKSGWNILLILIPVLGALLLFIFLCVDSMPGANAYGQNPRFDSYIYENFNNGDSRTNARGLSRGSRRLLRNRAVRILGIILAVLLAIAGVLLLFSVIKPYKLKMERKEPISTANPQGTLEVVTEPADSFGLDQPEEIRIRRPVWTAKPTPTPTPEPTPEPTPTPTPEPTSKPTTGQGKPGDRNYKYGVGETAERNGISITLLGYRESFGNNAVSPKSGNEFVFPLFEIVNNSNNDFTVNGESSFKAYSDDYLFDVSSSAAMALDGDNALDGTIGSGRKIRGYVAFEVPDNRDTLEVEFSPTFWGRNKFTFVVER